MAGMASSTRPPRPSSRRPAARAERRAVATPAAAPNDPAPADTTTVVLHTLGTALLAAALGVAIALVLGVSSWALAPHSAETGPDTPARLSVMAWLAAHHTPIDLSAGTLGLTPLGLLLLPGVLCYAAGRQLTRALRPADLGAAGRIIGLFALTYGVVVAITAGVSAGPGLRPHPMAGWLAATVLAFLAGGWGLLRSSGLQGELADRLPFALRQTLTGALAGLLTLVAFGAVVLALLLALAFPEALDMTRALDADLLGSVLLAVLGLALLPNLVLWVLSFTTGVGFSLGVGSSVGPQGVEYGALPVLPPLAAVPPEGGLPGWAMLVLAVPMLAGVVAGLVVHRRLPGRPAEVVAGSAATSGVLAGLSLGLLAWLSSGPAGAERLSVVGPTGWQVGLAAAAEMGLVAAVVAWEAHRHAWDGRLPLPALRRPLLRRSSD